MGEWKGGRMGAWVDGRVVEWLGGWDGADRWVHRGDVSLGF